MPQNQACEATTVMSCGLLDVAHQHSGRAAAGAWRWDQEGFSKNWHASAERLRGDMSPQRTQLALWGQIDTVLAFWFIGGSKRDNCGLLLC